MSASRIAVVLVVAAAAIAAARPRRLDAGAMTVTVTPNESAKRVDVAIGGKPFTSYIWPDRLKKPVLDPIRSAERHPRHARLAARPAPGRARRPSTSRRPVVQLRERERPRLLEQLRRASNPSSARRWARSSIGGSSAPTAARIAASWSTESDWVTPGGTVLLRERTQFVFAGDASTRTIDRIATLTALDRARRLHRHQGRHARHARRAAARAAVERAAESSPTRPARPRRCRCSTTPASPASTAAAKARRATRSGARAGAGRCSPAASDREPITIAMLDHPKNPGFPTYWHARGYGLFAANPLGQKVFSGGKRDAELHASSPAPRPRSATASWSSTETRPPIASSTSTRRSRPRMTAITLTVHVGLIGAGNISDTHARAAPRFPEVRIAAVYAPTREHAQRLAARHGAVAYDTLDGLPRIVRWTSSRSAARRACTPSTASRRRSADCTCSSRSRSTSPRPRADALIAEAARAGVTLGRHLSGSPQARTCCG